MLVTGGQRNHAMVERYVDNKGTIPSNPNNPTDPAALDDEVRFRTVYFRNLLP